MNISVVTLHKLIIKCIHHKQSIDVGILYHEHKEVGYKHTLKEKCCDHSYKYMEYWISVLRTVETQTYRLLNECDEIV